MSKLLTLMKRSALYGHKVVYNNSITDEATFTRASTAYAFVNAVYTAFAANAPRFGDLVGNGAYTGLIMEPARTNEWHKSLRLNGWPVNGTAALTADVYTSPDGTTNAAYFVPSATTSTFWLGNANGVSIVAGSYFSISGYFKRPSVGTNNRYLAFHIRNSTWSAIAGFAVDLQTETIAVRTGGLGTVTSVEIINVGNGWYRCMAHGCALNDGGTAAILEAYPTSSVNGSGTTTGDGTNGIAMWGMQFEKASFCSSYIPTTTTATVTRAADVCSITSLGTKPWFNASEGTLVVDYKKNGAGASTYGVVAQLDNGTDGNRIAIFTKPSNSSDVVLEINDTTVQQYLLDASIAGTNIRVKAALAYKANDSNGAYNGTVGTTDTNCSISAATILRIGITADFPQPLTGTIRSITYYPRRLSNPSLKTLIS